MRIQNSTIIIIYFHLYYPNVPSLVRATASRSFPSTCMNYDVGRKRPAYWRGRPEEDMEAKEFACAKELNE